MIQVRLKQLVTIIGCLSTATLVSPAAQVVSETYVSTAVTIGGAGTNNHHETWFSLSMVKPFAAAGTITAIGSNSVSDSSATWATDQFNGARGFYYIEFLDTNLTSTASGLMADILDTDGATKTITLSGDPRSLISVGAKYRIRPHYTFFDIFGPNNEAGLLGGANNNKADIVQIESQGKTPVTVFYWSYTNTQTNIHGWYTLNTNGYVPQLNFVIYPEQGIRVCRKGSNDVVLALKGQLKQTPTKVPVYPGNNALGALKAFKTMNLTNLNIYTGDNASGFMAGLNPNDADALQITKPDGTPIRYFYFDNGNYKGWMDWEYNPPVSNLIAPGSAFVILRRAATPFIWNIPGE